MLRYFYLLCLLIAINCTLCYDYISDHNLKHKQQRRLIKKNRDQHMIKEEGKNYVKKKGQEYDMIDEKEPIAQIDVASFIQKPDEYAVDNNFMYEGETKKSDANVNSYSDYGSPLEYNSKEDIVKRSNKRPYYLRPGADKPFDLGLNSYPNKGTLNSRHLNLDSMSLHGLNNGKLIRNAGTTSSTNSYERALYDPDSNIVHNPEKKCAIKEMMKLPFFFRNKSETTKTKKAKKRKLFCFNCSNKKDKENKANDSSMDSHDIKEVKKENLEASSKASMVDPEENAERLKPNNIKRDKRDEWLGDRERQLKELDEIQRKVDGVEILPSYGKLPEISN